MRRRRRRLTLHVLSSAVHRKRSVSASASTLSADERRRSSPQTSATTRGRTSVVDSCTDTGARSLPTIHDFSRYTQSPQCRCAAEAVGRIQCRRLLRRLPCKASPNSIQPMSTSMPMNDVHHRSRLHLMPQYLPAAMAMTDADGFGQADAWRCRCRVSTARTRPRLMPLATTESAYTANSILTNDDANIYTST